jgi:hypothetical protein
LTIAILRNNFYMRIKAKQTSCVTVAHVKLHQRQLIHCG